MNSVEHAADTTAAMRRLLLVAALLVLIMGIPLFIASTATETYFAWTIATPLTAAFLGASYWAAGILEFLASREHKWSNARIAVPAVFLFTVLTFVITLIHIDRFHFSAKLAITLAVTWAWLIVYAVVPVVMVIIMIFQRRDRGGDLPRTAPLTDVMRFMLAVQGAVLGIAGLILLLAPAAAIPLWPWSLTPLTAHAIGAWLLSVGFAVIHAVWENDYRRIRSFSVAYLVLAVLQLFALARFAADFSWGTIAGTVYVAFLSWMLLVGIALNLARRPTSPVAEPLA
ncbi:MAG: hypothetical protein AB7P20_11475 [Rhizobiaceae bacterium]